MPAAQSSYVDLHDQICTNQIKELLKHKLALKKMGGWFIFGLVINAWKEHAIKFNCK